MNDDGAQLRETLRLAEKIGESFGPEAAANWRRFAPNQNEIDVLVDVGRSVLKQFPGRPPGACALMSAVFSLFLEQRGAPPGYVVVGSLFVDATRVFGTDETIDGPTLFGRSNYEWDGHAWIVFGDRIADVSIFRTADSGLAPRILSNYVHAAYGSGKGLMICRHGDTGSLRYRAEYVLKQDQVDALGRGAKVLISRVDQP